MGIPESGLRFWGVRGTTATPAGDKLRYGGNTTCLAVQVGPGHHLMIDAGTGARGLGKALVQAGGALRIDALFTHFHFDHVEGLPLFGPMYARGTALGLHGVPPGSRSLQSVFHDLVAPPYFPVRLADAPAAVRFVELDAAPHTFGDLRVGLLRLNHPGGCSGYRLERGGRSVVLATDHEHGDPAVDRALVEFARGADHLIYDATYLPTEYEAHRGWGHSTWEDGVSVARAAGVKNLVLFHHDPDRTDDQLEAMLAEARQGHPATSLAREGDSIPL